MLLWVSLPLPPLRFSALSRGGEPTGGVGTIGTSEGLSSGWEFSLRERLLEHFQRPAHRPQGHLCS